MTNAIICSNISEVELSWKKGSTKEGGLPEPKSPSFLLCELFFDKYI